MTPTLRLGEGVVHSTGGIMARIPFVTPADIAPHEQPAFDEFVRKEIPLWAKVVKDSGAKFD